MKIEKLYEISKLKDCQDVTESDFLKIKEFLEKIKDIKTKELITNNKEMSDLREDISDKSYNKDYIIRNSKNLKDGYIEIPISIGEKENEC